jgi:hypothetical protein
MLLAGDIGAATARLALVSVEAGNLARKVLATGGVYLAGGPTGGRCVTRRRATGICSGAKTSSMINGASCRTSWTT